MRHSTVIKNGDHCVCRYFLQRILTSRYCIAFYAWVSLPGSLTQGKSGSSNRHGELQISAKGDAVGYAVGFPEDRIISVSVGYPKALHPKGIFVSVGYPKALHPKGISPSVSAQSPVRKKWVCQGVESVLFFPVSSSCVYSLNSSRLAILGSFVFHPPISSQLGRVSSSSYYYYW